jgi:multiple sugar transport system ATP-binding protein
VASITLEHVSKVHREAASPAVDDVSLGIDDGEFVVLVGPSGCGKTTLLRMIAGLEQITGGRLSIGDRVANDVAPQNRDVAMVFQNYALYPHMTAFENMAFALKKRRLPKEQIRERVLNAARLLGLEPYLERKPRAMSGGQRQRVAMGRAIVREPQAFLMDEPLSNLDAALRAETRTALKRLLSRLGTTTVYVTHDQVEAMTMADRIVVLRAGRIQQMGSPAEVYARPANAFVAGFIGSPAMNLVPVSADDGIVRLGGLELELDLPAGQLLVGFRADAFAVAATGAHHKTLTIVADVVEHMGNERFIYFQLPGVKRYVPADATASAQAGEDEDEDAVSANLFVARVGADVPVEIGKALELALDTRHLHLFDAETEERVELRVR